MERTTRIRIFIAVMNYAIVTVEILVMFAVIALIYTGDMMYFAVCCGNSVGALVLDEMLKAQCRSDNDWYDAYREAMDSKPLPGPAYRLARAVVRRRRLQRG